MRALGRQELSKALQAATKILSTQKMSAGPRVFEHLVARIATLSGTHGITALTRTPEQLYWTALNLQISQQRGKAISSRSSIDPMVSKWKRQFGAGRKVPVPGTSSEVVVTVTSAAEKAVTVALTVVVGGSPIPLADPRSEPEPPDPMAVSPDATTITSSIVRQVGEKLRTADIGELLGFERMVGQLGAPAILNIFRGHLASFETGAQGRRKRPVVANLVLCLLALAAAWACYLVVKRFVIPNPYVPKPTPSRQGTLAPEDVPLRPPDLVAPEEPGRAFPRLEMWVLRGTTREFIYADGGMIAFRRRFPDSDIEFTWRFSRAGVLVDEVKTWEPRVRYTFPTKAGSETWTPTVSWKDVIRHEGSFVYTGSAVIARDPGTGKPLSPLTQRLESSDGRVVAETVPGGPLNVRFGTTQPAGRRASRPPVITAFGFPGESLLTEVVLHLGPADPATQSIYVLFGDGAGFTTNPAMRFGAPEWWYSTQVDGERVLVHLERDLTASDPWDSYVVRARHRYHLPGTYSVSVQLLEATQGGKEPERELRSHTSTIDVVDLPAVRAPSPSASSAKTVSK